MLKPVYASKGEFWRDGTSYYKHIGLKLGNVASVSIFSSSFMNLDKWVILGFTYRSQKWKGCLIESRFPSFLVSHWVMI